MKKPETVKPEPLVAVCAGCGKGIAGNRRDPVISAKSLGFGNYHDACAKAEWKSREKVVVVKGKRAKATRDKAEFYVQSVLVVNGVSSKEYTWHNILSTYKEAVAYCKAQMSDAHDKKYGDPNPCNATSAKYVNCTIYLLGTTGKKTLMDVLIHPLAPVSTSVDDEEI